MNDLHDKRQRSLHTWRQLWSFLVFVIGVAITGFLIFAIFSIVKESWVKSGVSTLGAIVSGVAMKWVLKRRSEVVSEEKEGYADYRELEREQEDRKRGRQSRTGLVGRLNTHSSDDNNG